MKLQSYLIGISISSLICWLAFILTIFYLNPDATRVLALSSLFISLFFALAGTFTLVGFFVRTALSHNELYYANINVSFREGFLVSLTIIGLLALQLLKLLTWWDASLFIAIMILVEFYFLTKK